MEITKEDKNFSVIKDLIDKIIPYKKKIILFGSRASSNYDLFSDYDIFVIIEKSGVLRRELVDFQIKIKRLCAKRGIDIDLIIRDIDYSNGIKDFPGNIINAAIRSGIGM